MRRSTSSCFAIAVPALVALGCAGSPATKPVLDSIEVSVLIHSGLPNPSFRLEQAHVAQVGKLLQAAAANPTFRGTSVIPSILGYQGILIVNQGRLGGLPSMIAVRNEDVEARDGEVVRFLKDSGANLERFLLDQAVAQKAVTPEMIEGVRPK
jgi:hypothetical protein